MHTDDSKECNALIFRESKNKNLKFYTSVIYLYQYKHKAMEISMEER
jgi:hypothetical protein